MSAFRPRKKSRRKASPPMAPLGSCAFEPCPFTPEYIVCGVPHHPASVGGLAHVCFLHLDESVHEWTCRLGCEVFVVESMDPAEMASIELEMRRRMAGGG